MEKIKADEEASVCVLECGAIPENVTCRIFSENFLKDKRNTYQPRNPLPFLTDP